MWVWTLNNAGVQVAGAGAEHVDLTWSGHTARLALRKLHTLAPSRLPYPAQRGDLLLAATASVATRERARELGWSLVADDGTGWVHFDDTTTLELAPAAPPPAPARPGRGAPAWGRSTVTRFLMLRPPMSQNALAHATGLSQPRISQLLSELGTKGLATRTTNGWAPVDRSALLAHWVTTYPGPRGVSTWWLGLETPGQQAQAALSVLGPGARVSGDVAADAAAPWRTPTQAVLYAPQGVDLSAAQLTPAAAEEATTVLVVPADPGVWAALPDSNGVEVMDGLQVLWDLLHAPGPDAMDAAARWRTQLLGLTA